jgi:hypothetical protein
MEMVWVDDIEVAIGKPLLVMKSSLRRRECALRLKFETDVFRIETVV